MHETRRRGTVLVVEDAFIQSFIRVLLSRDKYCVIEADATKAVKLLTSDPNSVDVLITNTPEFFAAFARHLAIVYVAAMPDLCKISEFHNWRALRKPFSPDHLLGAVSDLIAEAPGLAVVAHSNCA